MSTWIKKGSPREDPFQFGFDLFTVLLRTGDFAFGSAFGSVDKDGALLVAAKDFGIIFGFGFGLE